MSRASVRTKIGLANVHFRTAKLNRNQMREIEATYDHQNAEIPLVKKRKHQSAFISTIFATAATIECLANEFVDKSLDEYIRRARGKGKTSYKNVEFEKLESVARYSAQSGNKYSENAVDNARSSRSLNKILDIIGEEKFDENEDPQESLDLMFRMRSRLYHHKPEWIQGGPKTYTEDEYGFESEVKGRFDLNPFMPPGNAFFPTQCTSEDCATWAINNTSRLINSFGEKTGYDRHFHREKLE